MEPDAERAHHPAVRDFTAQRAKHLLARERGRVRHVPKMARLARQGQ